MKHAIIKRTKPQKRPKPSRRRQRSPYDTLRALATTATVLAIISGVTFAALLGQRGVLQGNTIETASASLQVSADGHNFSSIVPGFAFSNVLLGGPPVPMNGYILYLKNVGTTPLSLTLGAGSTVNNPGHVDLSKVHIFLTYNGSNFPAQDTTLQALIDADSTGGMPFSPSTQIYPNQILSYSIRASLDADAVNGPSANLSNIDLNFGGTSTN